MPDLHEIQIENGQVYELPDGSGVTYTLSKSGNSIILTGSGGDVSSVIDDNTTYSISISGHAITLTPSSGTAQTITVPDNNTTYTLSRSGHTLTLTPSSGSAQSVTLPDNNTTYSLSLSGHTLTLTPSSGSAQSVTLPDNNTWRGYTLREGITIFDNLTINPQSYAQDYTSLPSIPGYEPVALGGYNISLASSGGHNAAYCYAFAMAISYSSNELFWQIRNTHSTAAAKIRLYANILYLQQ